MKKITINNYQYWYNFKTNKLYIDEEGLDECPKNLFTAQEQAQFYNQLQNYLVLM